MAQLKRFYLLGTVTVTAMVILVLSSCNLLNPEDDANNDVRSPTITLNGDNPDTIAVGNRHADPGCTADDPEDGDITSSVTVDYGSIDTGDAETGTYTLHIPSAIRPAIPMKQHAVLLLYGLKWPTRPLRTVL